jgi:dipeptidyl aminopeptidase/acylaminoacyl peptidase
MRRYYVSAILFILILSFIAVAAEEKRAMTLEDLFSFDRIGVPTLSPDGKWVAFTVLKVDREGGRNKTNIYLIPAAGGEPKQLTSSGGDFSPIWSPDSKSVAFVSARDGSAQIWLIDIAGGEARKLSDIKTGASNPKWTPDGKYIICSASVLPGKCDKGTEEYLEQREKANNSAKIIDDLLYRHWDTWHDDGLKQHLFVVDVASGQHRDLMKDFAYDTPPLPFGGSEEFDISPDAKEIAFTAKTAPNPAWNTNLDVFIIPFEGGEPKNITAEFQGQDNHPVYSPDGRWLAYGSMKRPGFEADRIDIILYDRKTGERKNITGSFDHTVGEFLWAPDSSAIYFVAPDYGREPIFRAPVSGGEVKKIVGAGRIFNVGISPDGKTLVFGRNCLSYPTEVFRIGTDGTGEQRLTYFTQPVLDQIEIGKVVEDWFEGDRGDKIQLFTVLPPGFDPAKKWPLIHVIHGGPQQNYADLWTYGWNSQFFAAQGYVVALVAFHATPGYGQAFTDSVSKNWGGSPFIDIMKGTDYLVSKGYIDENRMGAGGGSYGGYMVDWICGHTDRFKALVSHSGVYDLESMYGATEELWFPEWDLGGVFWKNPELYEKWSPHKYAANFKTPTLITHGQLDYRVPVTQSMEFFTALRRQGIPARFIYFPDENHWILHTGNQMLWYKEFIDWMNKYVGPGPK